MPVFNKIGAVCALTALLTVGCSTVSKTVSDTAHAHLPQCILKVVDVNEVTNGIGKKIGTVSFQTVIKGLNHYPCFGISSGTRGFHIHEKSILCPSLKMENQALL
jgi:Cu-Zn family superoxide dismutase